MCVTIMVKAIPFEVKRNSYVIKTISFEVKWSL